MRSIYSAHKSGKLSSMYTVSEEIRESGSSFQSLSVKLYKFQSLQWGSGMLMSDDFYTSRSSVCILAVSFLPLYSNLSLTVSRLKRFQFRFSRVAVMHSVSYLLDDCKSLRSLYLGKKCYMDLLTMFSAIGLRIVSP